MIDNLRYPIGKWAAPQNFSPEIIDAWISDIGSCPYSLEALISGLNEEQLGWKYRSGGWTIRQICHHLADSHMNAYIRHKLTMTEELPTINPYKEELWAVMADVNEVSMKEAVQLLKLIHHRWTIYLKSLLFVELQRAYFHPEKQKRITMEESIGMYSWHCRHHLGHIELAIRSQIIK